MLIQEAKQWILYRWYRFVYRRKKKSSVSAAAMIRFANTVEKELDEILEGTQQFEEALDKNRS